MPIKCEEAFLCVAVMERSSGEEKICQVAPNSLDGGVVSTRPSTGIPRVPSAANICCLAGCFREFAMGIELSEPMGT